MKAANKVISEGGNTVVLPANYNCLSFHVCSRMDTVMSNRVTLPGGSSGHTTAWEEERDVWPGLSSVLLLHPCSCTQPPAGAYAFPALALHHIPSSGGRAREPKAQRLAEAEQAQLGSLGTASSRSRESVSWMQGCCNWQAGG